MRLCGLTLLLVIAAEALPPGRLQSQIPAAGAGRSAAVSAEQIANPTLFRGGIELVALNVTVTDQRHHPVSGLNRSAFAVVEDGVAQDVSYFASSQVPLDLAIVLDTSSSMSPVLRTAQKAASAFVSTLSPGDRVTVLGIHHQAEILHAMSGDLGAAMAAIGRTRTRGRTALYNGLYIALRELSQASRDAGEVRRQVVAVLSDGEDTSSVVGREDVLDLARQAGVAVYAITLVEPVETPMAGRAGNPFLPRSRAVMKSFADETGARFFVLQDAARLPDIYATIADELAHQYTLGYVSRNTRRDGTLRRVNVRVIDRPDVVARTRAGYLAPRERP
jgi:Ca-activated chloride channel family protein